MTPGKPPQLVVQRQRHPWLARLSVAGGAALFVILALSFYHLGQVRAPGDWQRAQTAQERLKDERRHLIGENRRLSERLVALERAAEIDREAIAELRESLRRMQERLSDYQKELAFYRGIVSPEEAKAGVRIQQFGVAGTGESGLYRFNLVLIQAARHDRQIKGRVRLRIEGLRAGESTSLRWSDVALDSAAALVFSFKYFQELAGTFRLPRAFEPTLVEIEILPGNSGSEAFTDSYDWTQLVRAEE